MVRTMTAEQLITEQHCIWLRGSINRAIILINRAIILVKLTLVSSYAVPTLFPELTLLPAYEPESQVLSQGTQEGWAKRYVDFSMLLPASCLPVSPGTRMLHVLPVSPGTRMLYSCL